MTARSRRSLPLCSLLVGACAAALSVCCSTAGDSPRGAQEPSPNPESASSDSPGGELGVNPQPDPPSVAPIDVRAIVVNEEPPSQSSSGGPPIPGSVTLSGGADAIATQAIGDAGAAAQLWLWDWDGSAPPVSVAVAEDGSFGPVTWTDRANGPIRMQVRAGNLRESPIDVTRFAASVQPLSQPFGACLEVPLEVSERDGEHTFDIVNRCADALSLDDLVLRSQRGLDSAGDLAAQLQLPLEMPPRSSLAITLVATAEQPAEDLVLLNFSAASATGTPDESPTQDDESTQDRRAVTLY